MSKTADTPMVYDVDDESGEIVYRPANAAELAQAKVDAEQADAENRASLQSQIRKALADSDWVAIRAAETGTAAPKEWLDYRQQLRDLHGKAATAKDPAAVTLPDPPGAEG